MMTDAGAATTAVDDAARQYIRRRDRMENPRGAFDRGGRFCLSADERRECCDYIRSPSRAYPYSEMTHARSAIHVAHLHGADPKDVRKTARKMEV